MFQFVSVYSHPITEGRQSSNLEAGVDAKAVKEYWLLACSAFFLTAPRRISLGVASSSELVPPSASIINQDNLIFLAEQLLNGDFLIPNDSSLCQVD